MFRKRQLLLNQQYGFVLQQIEAQAKTYFPCGKVCANRFRIYKSVAHSGLRNVFLFCFSGEVSPENEQVKITYTMRPARSICIAALVLSLAFIIGVAKLCFNQGSLLFAAIGFVLNLVFYMLLVSQGIDCIRIFENSFTA